MWSLFFAACSPPPSQSTPALECPDMNEAGAIEFEVDTMRRKVLVHLPDEPVDSMPVIVFFHGHNGSAENVSARTDLARIAQQHSAITVAPDSADRFGDTWDARTGGRDLALFDDLVDCLVQELDADPAAIHVGGFSGGAVFATYLVMERSERLASATLFSGGLDDDELPYRTPSHKIPALVGWGGSDDVGVYKGRDILFEEMGRLFGQLLRLDDHLVVTCNYGGGHRLPGAAADILESWALPHRVGRPSPHEDGLVDLPDYCTLPDDPQ
ncbi:MAG: hypothetical protein KTR31_40845 [Myxococcales bacterium]|nr:hypothetical protein [Myxococcales bacterium]